jgi:uncharacterized membrane protein YfcA
MSTNPYAPPTAHVADVAHAEAAPRLWNPNAAANWSLLFSPVFGAILHMKNWDALGEPAKAAGSKVWAIAALVLIVALAGVSAMLPESKPLDAASRSIGLTLLLVWYFASGRAQARYVKEKFGATYPRRGWTRPLLIAVGITVGFFAIVFVIAFGVGMAGAR